MAHEMEENEINDGARKSVELEEKFSGLNQKTAVPEVGKGDGKYKTMPFHKLFSFSDLTDIFLMIIGTIGAVGNGVCVPVMTILLREVTDSFGQIQHYNEILHTVAKVCLKIVYFAVGSALASFLQVSCWQVTGERQASRIRCLYLEAVLRQDIGFYDRNMNTGEVIDRLSGDSILIQEAMGEKVGKFLQLTSAFVGAFIVAFVNGWLLTLILLPFAAFVILTGAAMTCMIARMGSVAKKAYAKAATVAQQTIGLIRTVASFTGEKDAEENYTKFLVGAYRSGIHEGFASGIGLGIMRFMSFCSYALALWFGSKMILENGYEGGAVITVIVAVFNGSMSLGEIPSCISAFGAGQAAACKMFETISRKSEIDAYDISGIVLDDIQGDIELRDIVFSYPARPDEQIFCGFSLSFLSGKTTALVGQTGSGKSTVISLIERFYDPQGGQVLIDGINLKEFQLKWIRGKIGLVSQEPILFTCSIKDNIAYGKHGATIEEIRTAAELANAIKFIDKLPQGLDTIVGEHGTHLSGGQKQRIAIARAILKDPRILLLDEATSALDVDSERTVQDALERIMINRTTVIVAHRLSTVKEADMIAVIHQGKVAEKGSHTELLNHPDGAFSRLISMQESSQVVEIDEKSNKQIESFRQLSERMSFRRSVSRVSSGLGNSSHHSLSVILDLHTRFDVLDSGLEDERAPPPEPEAPNIPILRLANLNKPEASLLVAGSMAAIVNGVIFPVYGVLLSKVIKIVYESPYELRKDSKFWSLMFLILGLVSVVVYPLQSYLFAVAGCKLVQRIRSLCFAKVVCMEIGWFDEVEHSSGAICGRLSEDATKVRCLVGDNLAQMVQITSSVIAALVVAFTANWTLSFIVLALLPLIGINGYIQVKSIKKLGAHGKLIYEEASQLAYDAVASLRTIASFCAEEKVITLYKEKQVGLLDLGIRKGLIAGAGFGLSYLLMYNSNAASFYAGARLLEHGKAKFQDIFQVFFALSMMASAISWSSSFAPDSSKAKAAVASLFSIIDRTSTIDPSDESGLILEKVDGKIELHSISFSYPSRPETLIFRDLNLAIQSGQTVALVGESGSGKSTIISLLQRFYDPDSGHITLDGIEIQKLQLKWLRQQMGLVSQEPVLFNGTIRENIAYGKGGNATETEIIAAAELANAQNFISSLQQGYDTVVGERGVQLSGGQKQRVAIARAIVKCPKIMLFDEATSALDAESERVVQDALNRVMANRTTVVVAHRLSTIKNADVIAVVKNGIIAEKGKHCTLMNIKDGCYASLVALHTNSSSS
ncbi:hypothetical protein K2173_022239 [Erythroxylum novogranatense]|uniref:Uncharacterized protein n=1 Tax=Erythroxylum novogranatense TaxID=1862640 RepID=A0AAV8SUF0_9ROSI|nr:hypothetical protein K2173_022239 [Erythroxylum novogranatense]